MLSSASYLDRLLTGVSEAFTPEVAERIVNMRADPELQRHLDDLADRNTEDLLSAEERSEYESLVAFGNFITILQGKAREILKGHTAA